LGPLEHADHNVAERGGALGHDPQGQPTTNWKQSILAEPGIIAEDRGAAADVKKIWGT